MIKKLVIVAIIISLISIMIQFYPPGEDFKRAVEEVLDESLEDRIYDIVWKKTFHYITFFESMDGFGTGGTITLSDSKAEIETGTTSGNVARVYKQPDIQGVITFSQPSRFRTSLELTSIAHQTIYITTGNIQNSGQGYGFKIVNNTLYGVTHDGSSENAITLQTLSVNEEYHIEARYLPSKGVIFLADDPTSSTLIREVGVSNSKLPSPAILSNDLLFYAHVTTDEDAAKVLRITFFEYWQRRNILR